MKQQRKNTAQKVKVPKEEKQGYMQKLLFPRFFLSRWWLKRKMRKYPHTFVIVNMEHLSGHHSQFFVKEQDMGFELKGKSYKFDQDMRYYNVDLGYFMYDYHESLSLPIKRKLPINELKATVEQDPLVEIEYMINPTTLKRFVISKIAEGIMQGQDLPKSIRRIFLLVGINLIITIIMLLVVLYMSGIFGEVQSII